MNVVGCIAPYASGGLGQHFQHVIELARADGRLDRYYSMGVKPGDDCGIVLRNDGLRWFIRHSPIRFFPAAINHLENDHFDRMVARRLVAPLESYTGFGGQSLRCFGRARKLGCRRLELIAANTHVLHVARLHAKAIARYPIEQSWLNQAQVRKTLREYELADVIHVGSEFTRQTFLAEGVPESKLRRLHYPTEARFTPGPSDAADDCFRIVYTGSLSVAKGVPLLVDAFARLSIKDAQLTLIGGSGTRGMRRFLQQAVARDPRIRIAPGDPLPHLRRASVYVHPSYDEGHGYAPMEALACGVPVIVTHDTGMKEYVREGVNGYVVPTGDVDAIIDRIHALRRARSRPQAVAVA